jgi:uncharacterized protein YecE (DUF72 family)
MKTQLYIGQSNLRGALAKYSSRFNLLELRAQLGRLPRATLLRRWRDEVPSDFVFSVMLSREVGRFGPNYEAELELALQAADALEAKWMVLQTDPTVGPSQRSRQRLQSLFARMIADGRRIAWEPHGVWQEDEALMWTHDLGVHLVRDIFRGDTVSQDIVYSRMPGIGTASRMSAGALENAADGLSQTSEAYIVIGGDAAGKVSQYLRALVRGEGGVNDFRHNAGQPQEVFDESIGDSDSDELDNGFEDIDEDSDLTGDDDEAESDDADDSEVDDSTADEDISDQVESESEHRRMPKKRRGAKRK